MGRGQYEQSLKHYRDLQNSLSYAKEEGIEEGYEKGKQEGKIEGKQEGKEEGKIKERTFIIRNGLDAGFTLEQISLLTKLSISELEEIIKQLD